MPRQRNHEQVLASRYPYKTYIRPKGGMTVYTLPSPIERRIKAINYEVSITICGVTTTISIKAYALVKKAGNNIR